MCARVGKFADSVEQSRDIFLPGTFGFLNDARMGSCVKGQEVEA